MDKPETFTLILTDTLPEVVLQEVQRLALDD
jgi:hypothetical protein